MARGKNLIWMLKYDREVPHENVLQFESGKRILKYNPRKLWFTEQTIPNNEMEQSANREERDLPEDALVPLNGWREIPVQKTLQCLITVSETNLRIPLLRHRKLSVIGKLPRLSGVIHRIPMAKSDRQIQVQYEEPVHTGTEEITAPEAVLVKIIPTPAPRKITARRTEIEPVVPQKVLKVIRRRREEEPKLIQPPSNGPKGILENAEKKGEVH